MAPKKTPTHAPYADMIKTAIVSLKDRKGSSLPALKKQISKHTLLSALHATPSIAMCHVHVSAL